MNRANAGMTARRKTIIGVISAVMFGWVAGSVQAAEEKPLVYPGPDGKLAYATDGQGNRIGDFSRCGYMGGGVRLPDLPVVATLSPLSGDADDTARIQSAIDSLAGRNPDNHGLRGALLLKRGTYRVSGTLKLAASGVVLRGEGQGQDGTILLGTGKEQRTLIVVGGKAQIREVAGSRQKIADDYVPWGIRAFELESTKGFSVGDSVVVFRPSTANWISDIGMDRIAGREGTKQWSAGGYDLKFERTVTAIKGNWIQLDAPLVNAMEAKYGGGFVYKVTENGRVTQVGVEGLRLVSEYVKGQENQDEAHAWTGLSLDHAADSWVRNVTTVHFSHAVNLSGMSKFVTVQDCACLKPVSLITGGRRYPYSINGQYGLVQRCYSDHARHAEATGSKVCGPNVFLDCLAENTHSDTGPHHRWAVGILWDNLKGGAFNAQDRGNMGSGHGWAGAQQVFWNCETTSICVQQPPTAQNYAIGCTGKVSKGALGDRKPGHYESHGTHVAPRSLYLKQLEDRLGAAAVMNITIEEQRKGPIYDWLKKSFAE
ncbi:MAG TPA: hypothetical protein VFY13_08015 [Luteolibacter sp.]|nr:hypothetical protein [Luteolibacter sp.]